MPRVYTRHSSSLLGEVLLEHVILFRRQYSYEVILFLRFALPRDQQYTVRQQCHFLLLYSLLDNLSMQSREHSELKCFLFSGLDIGTLIDVRRAQLSYRLSDEVTFFFSLNIQCWLFALNSSGLKSSTMVIAHHHLYPCTHTHRLDKNKKGQCDSGINVISCDANASPSCVTLKINGPLTVVAVRG